MPHSVHLFMIPYYNLKLMHNSDRSHVFNDLIHDRGKGFIIRIHDRGHIA